MIIRKSVLLISAAVLGLSTAKVAVSAEFNKSTDSVRQEAEAIPKASIQKNARTLAQEFLKAMVSKGKLDSAQGWQKSSDQYVALSISSFKERAPDRNPDFLQQRDIAAQESIMKAKEQIIRFIRTDLSSELVMTLPNTGLSTEYDKQLESFKYALLNAKEDYREALAEVDSARAESLKGVTEDDLIKSGIGQLFEKATGVKVDATAISDDKARRLAEARSRLKELEQQLSELKAQAAELQGAIKKETTSEIKMLAAMPLSGAIVVSQFESWLNGVYEVANIVTWSPKSEKMSRAIAMKETVEIPPTSRTIGSYMSQDWSTATGSRKFVDDQGDYYIIGIGQEIAGDGAALDVAQETATLIAGNSIGVAILSDLDSESALQRKAQELESVSGVEKGVSTDFAKSLEKTLSERIQNLQLQGIDYTYQYTKNPITGQDVVVAIAKLSVNSAKTAEGLEKQSFANTEDIVNASQRSEGVGAGLRESLAQENADLSEYEEGREEGLNYSGEIMKGGEVDSVADDRSKAENVSIKAAGSGEDAFGF